MPDLFLSTALDFHSVTHWTLFGYSRDSFTSLSYQGTTVKHNLEHGLKRIFSRCYTGNKLHIKKCENQNVILILPPPSPSVNRPSSHLPALSFITLSLAALNYQQAKTCKSQKSDCVSKSFPRYYTVSQRPF